MLAEIIPKVAGFERRDSAYSPRPSLAGPERCIRQMVYWAAGVERDTQMGDRFILTMDDSSWHEELTRDWINKTAYRLIDQQLPYDINTVEFLKQGPPSGFLPERFCSRKDCGHLVMAHHMHGHSDGALEDMSEDFTAYEHKAINHFTFQRYVGETWPFDYITQTCLSIIGLQDIIPTVHKGLLLIKNKNTAQYLELLIDYDRVTDTARVVEKLTSMGDRTQGDLLVVENIIKDAVTRFCQIHIHVMDRALPPRPYEYGTSFPCGYCGWEQTCWSTYEQEVTSLANNEADLVELADTARFYNELGAQMGDMKKQRDEVGSTIKRRLAELMVRHGKAGEYDVEIKLKKVKAYTVEARMQEELRVKKFVEKTNARK